MLLNIPIKIVLNDSQAEKARQYGSFVDTLCYIDLVNTLSNGIKIYFKRSFPCTSIYRHITS